MTQAGYIGGHVDHPSYEQVSDHGTGHLEAVRIIYDKKRTNFENLAHLFFEIHDPTQTDGQGPDLGEQYHSAIFTNSSTQENISQKLIQHLRKQGLQVTTTIRKASSFWPAEDYHQHWYTKKSGIPYCHVYRDRTW